MARFDTKKLHAGYNPLEHNGAVSVPIYATAAFEMGTVAHSDDMFSFLGYLAPCCPFRYS